ncbi:MAG: hypothetical protein U0939_05160 [Pirellulales bacterium]
MATLALRSTLIAERAVQSSMMEPLGLVRAAALADQRVALLRTIEAIRAWSSKHEGQLPDSPDQLELPAPRDCISNGPLQCARAADGKPATLAGAELAMPIRTSAGFVSSPKRVSFLGVFSL